MQAQGYNVQRAYHCGYRVFPRCPEGYQKRTADRSYAYYASLLKLHAVREVTPRAGQAERVSPRPRGLFCREGGGEGDPHPGATVQEPHHCRGGQEGDDWLLGDQLHPRKEESHQPDGQEQEAVPQAQLVLGGHPRRRGNERDGRYNGPGDSADGGKRGIHPHLPGSVPGGVCFPEGLHPVPGLGAHRHQDQADAHLGKATPKVRGGAQCSGGGGAGPRPRFQRRLQNEGSLLGSYGEEGDTGTDEQGPD